MDSKLIGSNIARQSRKEKLQSLFYLVHLLYMYYYLPIIFLPFTTYIPLFNRLCSWECGT